MNKNKNLVLVLLAAFMVMGVTACGKKDGGSASERDADGQYPIGLRDADGQYPIGSKVQVYDGNLKPTDAYFTFLPSNPNNQNYDNAVILNFPFNSALLLRSIWYNTPELAPVQSMSIMEG
jgi:hypothetical protein